MWRNKVDMFKFDVIWNLQKGCGGFRLWQIKNNMNKTMKFEKLEFKTQNSKYLNTKLWHIKSIMIKDVGNWKLLAKN